MTLDVLNIAMVILGTFYWIDFAMSTTPLGMALGQYVYRVPVEQAIELMTRKLPGLYSHFNHDQLLRLGRLILIARAVIPALPWLLLVLLAIELQQWYLLYLVLPKLLDIGRRLFWI